MYKMVQIRNVPEAVHRRLKARAAHLGLSMSEYVLREIERLIERPTREELLARIAQLPPIELAPPASEILREERARR